MTAAEAYFGPSSHGRTGFGRTVVLQGTIKHADCIVKIHCVDCQPFIEVFARGQANSFLDIALTQGGVNVSFECQPLQ